MPIHHTAVLATTDGFLLQNLSDGAVVLRLGDGQLYACNETTQDFLKLVDGNRSFQDIVDALLKDYSIDRDTLTTDMQALAQELLDEGVIQTV